jgi:uncharacterized protein (TIGR03437 family)
MFTKAPLFVLLLTSLAWQAKPQSFDTSGNGLLTGAFNFRQVVYVQSGDSAGDLSDTAAVYGTMTFDGQGNYTLNASVVDFNNGSGSNTTSGTYAISASGLGFISSPFSTGDFIFGLVSNGIFVGSSTENQNGYNDLFIAAQAAQPAPTNGSFNGAYWVVDADPTGFLDALFQLNPDGLGNLNTVNVSGYLAGTGSATTLVTQTITGASYAFSNGAATLAFGGTATSSTLITGSPTMYISADGNFIFGGAPNGFDMFVGVRTTAGGQLNYGGLYYQAGFDQDESQLATGVSLLDAYYGSMNVNPGVILGHQRQLSLLTARNPFNFTYYDPYALQPDGSYDDAYLSQHFVVGAGGAVRVGFGTGPFLGLNVALQAPGFSGSGVFLNPAGVVNAASSIPFTEGVSPGEMITLYGTGLAPSVMQASTIPLPNVLNGVQVLVNNRQAPLVYVSPSQISAVVPFETESTGAQIQVLSNGASSSTVSAFVNLTTPGVFTNPSGGIGYAKVLHSDNITSVTPSSPAQIGEEIAVYLSGMGTVTPVNPDGAAGPSTSQTDNTIFAAISGTSATVNFSGLAPGFVGLYQVNVTVPAGVPSGVNFIDFSGPDSYNSEATIAIGTPTPTAAAEKRRAARPFARRPQSSGAGFRRPGA